MPCSSYHMEPTEKEKESLKVILFLSKLGFEIKDYSPFYGDEKNLDTHTSMLCKACRVMLEDQGEIIFPDVNAWYVKHQKHDIQRIRNSTYSQKVKKLFTSEERKQLKNGTSKK